MIELLHEKVLILLSKNSKECIVCYYSCFNHEFNFQNSVYNDCHDLTTLYLNLSNIAITVKGIDYCCINNDNTKSNARHLFENLVLEDPKYI